MNRVCLVGRLTRDVELRYSGNGTAIAKFSLAIPRAFKKDETDFINIVVFKTQAENCANYLSKGKMASVDGRIQTGSYEKEGQKVYTFDVIADNVRFLSPKENDGFIGQSQEFDESEIPF